ncbi:MAG: hypothetical protein SFV21_10105 [Rhodospirillaceae bacterium]|nr:hypothetical protein [Rhodospirillaceae bacterium]
MHKLQWAAAIALTAGLITACGDPTKEDILKKAEGVDTKQRLEQVLGTPDDISKLGPVENWTYNAANGTVSFVIAGDMVTLSSTGDKKAE